MIDFHWHPDTYLGFKDERARPAYDLLAQVNKQEARVLVDLGCGTGHITEALVRRWPFARAVGIDSSPAMIDAAMRDGPNTVEWIEGNIADWAERAKLRADVIFSNAALHWLADHKSLFERLMLHLAPAGVLAVQMPNNFDQPTHQLILEGLNHFGLHRLQPAWMVPPVSQPADYYNWLAPLSDDVNIWQTTYIHVLEGPHAVRRWVEGSALRPILQSMEEKLRPEFLSWLDNAYDKVYPMQSDGRVLMPFRRLFIVAMKPDLY